MRTTHFWKILFLLGPLVASGCEDKVEGWYDSVPDGGAFHRANTVRFYYIDKNGNNLIDPSDSATYPVACASNDTTPTASDSSEGKIATDQEENIFFAIPTVPGDSRRNRYTFYVWFKGDFDRMDLTYRYAHDGIGGDGWSSQIVSWKMNGKHIYADKDGLHRKVYIQKADGKTEISNSKTPISHHRITTQTKNRHLCADW